MADCDRIAGAQRGDAALDVHSVFVVGPPRTGTTLLCKLLGNSENVLSLTEPFHLRDLLPNWVLRCFYRRLQREFRLQKVTLPRSNNSRPYWKFMQSLAHTNRFKHLVVKEVFREVDLDIRWANMKLLDSFAAHHLPIVATIRHPWDAAASTINLLDWLFFGWRGRMVRTLWPTVPRFKTHDAIVEWAARNWVCFTEWALRRELFLVRYEDFVRQPEAMMRRICEYCGIPFREQMVNPRHWPRAFGGIGAPEVLLSAGRPVHVTSVGRGKHLTARQKEIISDICWPLARQIGYELDAVEAAAAPGAVALPPAPASVSRNGSGLHHRPAHGLAIPPAHQGSALSA